VSIGSGQSPSEPEPQPGKRPGRRWLLALISLVGTFVTLASYDLISSSAELGVGTVAAASKTVPSAASAASSASRSAAGSPGSVSPSPPGTPSSPARHLLTVIAAAAFGPEGTADGDNPSTASRIIDVSTNLPWYSQWYATPGFGGLRSGTGLLLTLGEVARVRDVRLVLGSAPGADIQVRAGDSPTPDLPVVAGASDVHGTVLLKVTKPVTGRYVLIWFTRLPPDGYGHYQADVYDVDVGGLSDGPPRRAAPRLDSRASRLRRLFEKLNTLCDYSTTMRS
jgi:hypothetical protein